MQYIERCGAVDYALFLANRMGHMLTDEDFRQQALNRVCEGLVKGRQLQAAKIHALRMALHPRAVAAGIKVIGSDLLRMCVQWVATEKIVLWEEVLEKWLKAV